MGSGPVSPSMAIFQCKVQELSSSSVHNAGCLCIQNPEEVGMNFPMRAGQAGREQTLASSMSFI